MREEIIKCDYCKEVCKDAVVVKLVIGTSSDGIETTEDYATIDFCSVCAAAAIQKMFFHDRHWDMTAANEFYKKWAPKKNRFK